MTIKRLVHECLWQPFLYQPRPENNVIVHQQVNEHTMEQSHNELLLSNENKCSTDTITWMILNIIMLSEIEGRQS